MQNHVVLPYVHGHGYGGKRGALFDSTDLSMFKRSVDPATRTHM